MECIILLKLTNIFVLTAAYHYIYFLNYYNLKIVATKTVYTVCKVQWVKKIWVFILTVENVQ